MKPSKEQAKIVEHIRNIDKELNKQEHDPVIRKSVRDFMMNDSPKTKPPKRLFHGSPIENKESIMSNGIYAHKLYGNIYFCEKPEDVLMFIKDSCDIYEVDPKKLLPKRWRISLDHNKRFYPCEVYAYYGDVPKEAIVNVIREDVR